MKTRARTAAPLVSIVLCLAAATAARAQVYTFEVIADTKSGAFTDLGLFPSINSAGTVSFRANTPTGPAIFTGGNGAPAAVVDGASFAELGVLDPKMDDAGRVAFFGVQPDGVSGIFAKSGGALEAIARSGESFASNELFRAFGAPSINNAALVGFTAASTARNLGAFVQTNRVGFASGSYSTLAGENYINLDGDIAVVGQTNAGVTQVLVADPPGALTSVADTVTSGFSSIDLISPYLTTNGLTVVFIGTRADTGVRGIYRVAGGQVFPVVTTANGFTDFSEFAMSADGAQLAFTAVTLDGRTGIFRSSNPVTGQVIVAGDAMPVAGGQRRVDSVSLGDAGLNAAGQIAFYATFSDNPAPEQTGFAAIFRGTPAAGQGSSSSGPSTGSMPYVVPSRADVSTVAVFTVGDSVNNKPDGVTPYRMVGIPDGLGLLDNGDKTFTLFMNHEIAPTSGIPRQHHGNDSSGRGAFVSQWRIVGADHPTLPFLQVLDGRDFTQTVRIFDIGTRTYRAPLPNPVPGAGEDDFNRFCSADLPAPSAFFANGLGTTDRLYMNGEESPAENGRAFAHVVSGSFTGTTFELPRLGDAAWENVIANPFPQAQTIVMLNDDQSAVGGQVYLYVGTKLDPAANPNANPPELAGLNNGTLYGVAVNGFITEPGAGIPAGTRFTLPSLGDVTAVTGPQLEAQSNALAVTNFARPEDGQWDPNNLRHYLFTTTGQQGTEGAVATRLWRLVFDDITKPMQGGTIEMLLDGSEGIKNLDNMTIDAAGNVYLQEDLGNNAALSKIFRYNIATDSLIEIAANSPEYFTSGSPNFQTNDDETTGIIDASSVLGPGWFLANSESHSSANDSELVERGQLVAINVGTPLPSPTPLPSVSPIPTPVPTPAPPRLQNISTRGRVQTGDNVLIGGFFVTGSNQKRVIVRGLGPSLNVGGVPVAGRLEDPTLELFDANGGSIATNDNWREQQEAEIEASGLAPMNDKESAIVRTLNPSFFTAVVRGKNNSTGIALAEAYDLDATGNPRLANISTRGFVETGDNALIGGFIVGGGDAGQSSRVVVRALGPTLAQRDVPTPLQDPTLQLFDRNGVPIAFNNNWRDTQASEIEQTGLAPNDDRESAIVTTLAAGAYTAVVRGLLETTGSGLVEIYNVPPAQ